MAMHRLDKAVNKAVWPMLTSSVATAPTPTTRLATIGVPVRGDTFASAPENGSAFSRAIENTMRAPAVWQASVQANTATATVHSSSRPSTAPNRSETTQARPPVARLPSVRLGAAISPARISRPPPRPDTATARTIDFGVVRRGARVSPLSTPDAAVPDQPDAAISAEASQANR